jgi:hypothetical protein
VYVSVIRSVCGPALKPTSDGDSVAGRWPAVAFGTYTVIRLRCLWWWTFTSLVRVRLMPRSTNTAARLNDSFAAFDPRVAVELSASDRRAPAARQGVVAGTVSVICWLPTFACRVRVAGAGGSGAATVVKLSVLPKVVP